MAITSEVLGKQAGYSGFLETSAPKIKNAFKTDEYLISIVV